MSQFTEVLRRYGMIVVPAVWLVVIISNVWYHGPKAWIFVTLGTLITLGIFVQLAIAAEKKLTVQKKKHDEILISLGEAHRKTANELTIEKTRAVSYWHLWTNSEIRMVEVLAAMSRSLAGVIRYEYDPNNTHSGIALNFMSDLMAPVVYLFVPTEDGVKQIRWLLHSNEIELFDFSKPYEGGLEPGKNVDVTQTQEEAFANIKAFLLAPLLAQVTHELPTPA